MSDSALLEFYKNIDEIDITYNKILESFALLDDINYKFNKDADVVNENNISISEPLLTRVIT